MKKDIDTSGYCPKNYDRVKECEAQGEKELADEWRKYIAKCKARVVDYLNNVKQRKTFYLVEGYAFDLEDEDAIGFYYSNYHAFSDEQRDRIIQLVTDTYNEDLLEDEPVLSFEEIIKEGWLNELAGCCEELDDLLFNDFREEGKSVEKIDFEHPIHLYEFCYLSYDERKRMDRLTLYFSVELTDEEYIYLLTQKLMNRKFFTFNSLIESNPELACKINHAPHMELYDEGVLHFPFLVIMTEVNKDVEAIDGPLSSE